MTVEGLEELFQQTWLDHVLHYGLLVGAIFQLVCIAAIVILPPRPEEETDGEPETEFGGAGKEEHSSSGPRNGHSGSSAGGGKGKKGKGARKRR